MSWVGAVVECGCLVTSVPSSFFKLFNYSCPNFCPPPVLLVNPHPVLHYHRSFGDGGEGHHPQSYLGSIACSPFPAAAWSTVPMLNMQGQMTRGPKWQSPKH